MFNILIHRSLLKNGRTIRWRGMSNTVLVILKDWFHIMGIVSLKVMTEVGHPSSSALCKSKKQEMTYSLNSRFGDLINSFSFEGYRDTKILFD